MGVGRFAKQVVGSLFPATLLYRGKVTVPARIAVTFDDGPHASHTRQILDILARASAKATFFVQGAEVRNNPGPLREVHAAGHQIANHGFSHRGPKEIGDAAFVREVLDAQKLIEDTIGASPSHDFRPPYGSISFGTFIPLTRAGYRFVFWSFDSQDSWLKEPSQLVARIDTAKLHGGDVLLFHEDYAHTVTALPAILASMRRRSFTLSSTNEIS